MTKTLLEMMLEMQKPDYTEAYAMWGRLLKSPKVEQFARHVDVATTPGEVVLQQDRWKLIRYSPEHPPRFAEPILICFSLINRPYILDLQSDRSVVRQLLTAGFPVYLIDWGEPEAEDHVLRLEDYVTRYLHEITQWVCEDARVPGVHLMGYCMGGSMAAMYAALVPESIRTLVLLAAPIDFHQEQSLLTHLAREEHFNVDALVDACGNCPGPLLQSTFLMMNPVQNFVEKYLRFFERVYDERFLENFFAMERWANDNVPVAGETFRELIKWLYRENRLVRNELSLAGRSVELGRIACPLLLLTADRDHLVPPAATTAIMGHVASADVRHLTLDAGHIGLAVSSRAHETLWPQAATWLSEHSHLRPRRRSE